MRDALTGSCTASQRAAADSHALAFFDPQVDTERLLAEHLEGAKGSLAVSYAMLNRTAGRGSLRNAGRPRTPLSSSPESPLINALQHSAEPAEDALLGSGAPAITAARLLRHVRRAWASEILIRARLGVRWRRAASCRPARGRNP